MSALSIQPTFPIFTDIDGQPLEDGYVWIGVANLDPQTNPINVYWDAALTLPAAQPIRTLAGYPANSGTPARLYVNSDYSIRVMNKNGSAVYSAPEATERYSEAVVAGINASQVVYDPAGANAVQTTAEAKLRESVSVKDFGAVGDGVSDDTTAIQNAINYASSNVSQGNRVEVFFPFGVYNITGLTLPTRVILRGPAQLNVTGNGNTAITMDGTLYATIYDLYILILEPNQKGIRLIRTGSSFSQLNTFFNVAIEGQISAGTVGIEINDAFTNSFYGCQVIRTATQVTFSNGANANHFYGGELRSNNTNVNGSFAVIHNSGCSGNGFHGTVIENQREPIQMNGGMLTIDCGCYIEAFASPESIQMNGGHLVVRDNYLNNGFIFVRNTLSSQDTLVVDGNQFDGGLSNINYPFIQFLGDFSTKLILKGNEVKNSAGVLYRPREWVTGGVWTYRSIANRREFNEITPVRFQARLSTDRTDVTGDGTAYTVNFGANQQFDDGSNIDNNGVFTAPENGVYQLDTRLWLSGLSTVDHTNIIVQLVTSNRTYNLVEQSVNNLTTAGRLSVGGGALVDMERNDTAVVVLTVAGTAKTVDVLRFDAVSGFTMFTGFKVA